MKKSDVLQANKVVIILNWSKNYHWEGKPIKDSIKQTIKHYEDMTDVEPDITTNDVKILLKEYIYKCITDDNYLRRELNNERKTYIQPSAKNIREFFEVNELPYKNINDYRDFLELAYNSLS